jgi:hypothetical protein
MNLVGVINPSRARFGRKCFDDRSRVDFANGYCCVVVRWLLLSRKSNRIGRRNGLLEGSSLTSTEQQHAETRRSDVKLQFPVQTEQTLESLFT